jgi:hypothetical protein
MSSSRREVPPRPTDASEERPETGAQLGRPRQYEGKVLPVSFNVPADLREAGSEKRRATGFNLTRYLAVCYRRFVEQPVSESYAFIEKYEAEHGPSQETGDDDVFA